jgi:hypothetical protein
MARPNVGADSGASVIWAPGIASFQPKEVLMPTISEKALDGRARRAARRIGLIARRSRWRLGSIDNLGGFMLIDPRHNFCVAGPRFDLEAEAVIDYCQED